MADPYYANVSLLLPMNGANNGTVFTDYSATPKTITRYGDAKTVTAQSQYYGSSGYFDGSGDYLATPNSADFNFGTGDFTIEFWLRTPIAWSSQPSSSTIVGQKLNDASNGWVIYRDGNQPSKINARIGGTNNLFTTSTPTPNTWEHWRVVRSSTSLKWYKNGVLDASGTNSTNVSEASASLKIGMADTWANSYLNTYLQDLRITKAVARATEDFTPPANLLPAISGTILDTNGTPCARTVHLFDRASGTKLGTTISDASTGQYALYAPPSGNEVMRVVLADEPTLYNDIIDRILPA